jgi:hypothetical protein
MNIAQLYEKLTPKERRAWAERAGVKEPYIYQLARGFKDNPPIRTVIAICAADKRLKITKVVEQFKADTGPPQGQPSSSETAPAEG